MLIAPALPATASAEYPRRIFTQLWQLFVHGIIWPGITTILLCFLALELTASQWWQVVPLIPFGVALYALPEAFIVRQLLRPLNAALPPSHNPALVSAALVRALNLPYYTFLRITLMRGPLGAVSAVGSLALTNQFNGGQFATWQMVMFPALVLFFACPAYAMMEYFLVSRRVEPLVERLWQDCAQLSRAEQSQLIAVRLKTKLLYLCVFITALPLLFVALSALYKVYLLVQTVGATQPLLLITPLIKWIAGALAVCIAGAVLVSLMTAQEVSRAAARLIGGMNEVEQGNLNVDLKILGTDEYADLTRGFNLMTDGLREEVRVLELSQDLAGTLQLDALITRILAAAKELLDAERSSLLLHDPERGELFSRIADGLRVREIRMADHAGIAGAVFSSGKGENVANAYADPRFHADVDHRTGYQTKSILCLPIFNKAGLCIGVTQVLNKKDGGSFNQRDEQRFKAFTAQIAIALENARLFDEVLSIKNYNDNVLASSTNGVITLNNQRIIVTANAAAAQIIGAAPGQMTQRDVQSQFMADNPWISKSVAKVQVSGSSDSVIDAELLRLDGSKASVNLTTVPLTGSAGEIMGVMLNFDDFTAEKRLKSTMSRYMSPEVAEALLASGDSALGGQLQKVSVLFSDVRGFTSATETLGARETVAMLNEYFEEMVEVVFAHKGTLDKYIGDAIMASFGTPFVQADDADRAVATAIDMLRALAAHNAMRARQGKPPMAIGVGIATGEVVVGNIGSHRRMEFTVIGDGVNLASRLESATKFYGVSLLLPQATVDALRVPVPVREIDRLRVRGKDQSVTIYEALDAYAALGQHFPSAALALYNQGLAAYRKQDWPGAERSFSQVLTHQPQDRPSQIYLQRIAHYRQSPPAAEWAGVWEMHDK